MSEPNGAGRPGGPPAGGMPKPQLPWERVAQPGSQPPSDREPGRDLVAKGVQTQTDGNSFAQIKGRVHRRLLERLNLSNLDKLTREQVTDAIRKVTLDLIAQESVPLNFEEREELVKQVLDEIFGLGPIQPLIDDPEVSDVLVNTFRQ